MNKALYFAILFLGSWMFIEVIKYLFQIPPDKTDTDSFYLVILLLVGFYWIEYFKVVEKKTGIWQIVSHSTRDRLSLITHLAIFAFLTGLLPFLHFPDLQQAVIWLLLFSLVSLSFFITCSEATKPYLRSYFFEW